MVSSSAWTPSDQGSLGSGGGESVRVRGALEIRCRGLDSTIRDSAGAVGRERVFDCTPLYDAVATMDPVEPNRVSYTFGVL